MALRLALFFAALLSLALVGGCDSALEEAPFSQISPENFFNTEQDFVAAAAGAYAQLRELEDGPRRLQEHSSDEMMVPTRGPDWGDGGVWRALTQHTWDANNPRMSDSWNQIQVGIARTNGVLEVLNTSTTLSEGALNQFRAEMRFLRAYYYYQLMDLFGNVPIVVEQGSELEFPTQPVPPDNPAPQNTRQEVFDFLLSELTGCTSGNFSISDCVDSPGGAIRNLPNKGEIDYGRATKGAGYALLARLLLNAEIYTGEASASGISPGTAMYDGAAAAADWIINSGQYELETDYFANFAADNFRSPEIIFAATHAAAPDVGFQRMQAMWHYNHLVPQAPWNGFSTIAEFYKAYALEPGPDGEIGTEDDIHTDVRGKTFLVGRQYESPNSGCSGDDCFSDPNTDIDGDGDALVYVRGTGAPPLNITLEIPSITLEGNNERLESPGARIQKFEIDPAATDANMGNDYPLFRLGEIYLIKAEAENEVSGPAAALPFLMTVRERSFPNGGAEVTPSSQEEMRRLVLQERGFEMIDEMVRRQDLIRYEFAHGGVPTGAPYTSDADPYAPTFTAPWLFKEPSQGFRALFPIPEAQLSVNPNLQQNPGY